ncbi:unnamed protein product [Cyclocybe aegerita]|uniref:Uncharacterized protein n=1 Tax=Cyclocybe aegerita TaxID=1973307 RepID=A0A8S0VZ23_CYCAE|nr:unnamed protein product [Cyclocybe aegerita]
MPSQHEHAFVYHQPPPPPASTMSSASPPRSFLPHEIRDHIIDVLATSSPGSPDTITIQALRACSLASRTLHTRAYHHLFSFVFIELEEAKLPTKNIALLNSLRALLHESVKFPGVGLVYHLQAFTLAVHGHGDQCYTIFKKGRVGDILMALYGETYGVQRFKLSPNLRYLSISGIMDLPRSLFSLSRLDYLYLYNVSVRRMVDRPSVDTPRQTVLSEVKRIAMHSDVPILDLAYPHTDPNAEEESSETLKALRETAFASLKELRINFSYMDRVPGALEVAAHAASSLSSLHIYIFGLDPADPPPSPPRATNPRHLFHPLTALETLRITKQVVRPLTERCIVNPLWRLLVTSTLPANLRTLIVESMAERRLVAVQEGQQPQEEDRPQVGTPRRGPYTVRAAEKEEANRAAAWRAFDEDAFHVRARDLVADALPRLRSSRSKSSSANSDSPKTFEVDIAIIRAQPGTWDNEIKVKCGGPALVDAL